MPLKPNAKNPFTREALIGKIRFRSPKDNLVILAANTIRSLSEDDRESDEPKTTIALYESDGMPSTYVVNAPINVVDALWDRALKGEVIDLTVFSGKQSLYLKNEDDYNRHILAPKLLQSTLLEHIIEVEKEKERALEAKKGRKKRRKFKGIMLK